MFWKQEPKIEVVTTMTEVELASKLAELMGDVESIEITKEGVKEVFQQMGRIDGLLDFLRDVMMNDIKRYFNAATDREREIIRGGYSRTAYIRGLVIDALKKT